MNLINSLNLILFPEFILSNLVFRIHRVAEILMILGVYNILQNQVV